MAESDRWDRRLVPRGRLKRCRRCGGWRIDPRLFVNALQQLQTWCDPPRELREPLVLLVGPRELRIDTGLAVVIAHELIAAEEPQPIAAGRSADIRREVAVFEARVPAGRLAAASDGAHDRLARQTSCLSIVRSIVQIPRARLPSDDIDHGALQVAEFGGRADRLDLDFLNEVDARLRAGDAAARAREVGPVDEELIVVDTRTERRHAGGGHGSRRAARRGRRDPWRGPDQIEHAEPAGRDRPEVLGSQSRLESAAPSLDA